MIDSIIERNARISPLTETEKIIMNSAIKLFLQEGYSKTTLRNIADDCGIRQGTLTYHFHAKEDMLKLLMEELMEYHLDMIEQTAEDTNDKLFAYAAEIAVQIALCDINRKAWDLYFAAYSHPMIFEVIKDWGAKKNHMLLTERLPGWTESDFRHVENATSGIELAALMSRCDRYYTLKEKIALTLDSMMKIYDIPKEERDRAISQVNGIDCEKIGKELFDRFIEKAC